jgi:hypothetical protein
VVTFKVGTIPCGNSPSGSMEQEGGLALEPVCILRSKGQTLVSDRTRKQFLCFKAVHQTRIRLLFICLLTYRYKCVNLNFKSDFSFRGSGCTVCGCTVCGCAVCGCIGCGCLGCGCAVCGCTVCGCIGGGCTVCGCADCGCIGCGCIGCGCSVCGCTI